MEIKTIIANFITRVLGGALGFAVAWFATIKIGIPVPVLSPEEVNVLAGAIGVVGSEALWDGIKRLWKKITSS